MYQKSFAVQMLSTDWNILSFWQNKKKIKGWNLLDMEPVSFFDISSESSVI